MEGLAKSKNVTQAAALSHGDPLKVPKNGVFGGKITPSTENFQNSTTNVH